MGSFSDEIAFKLGQCPEDMEDQLPTRDRGIDLLGETLELDSPPLQLRDGFDHMHDRETKAIKPQEDERIALVKKLLVLSADVRFSYLTTSHD